MATTIKKTSFALGKRTKEQLEFIMKEYGENQSTVLNLAITELYEKVLRDREKNLKEICNEFP